MKIRADVAALLRAGLSDREIARQLKVDAKTVGRNREHLRIAKSRPGRRPAAGPQELFRKRTRPTETGGHLEWTGHRNSSGVPAFRWAGHLVTATRIAFIARYEREPVGYVRATCGHPGCVAPDHVEDRPMRARNKATFDAIFGGAT
jgi:hypothetical protein